MWTTYVPPTFLKELRKEFADTPKVLNLLSQKDGWQSLADAIDATQPDVSFYGSEIQPFLKAVKKLGAKVVIDRLRTFEQRNQLAHRWETEIKDIVERNVRGE